LIAKAMWDEAATGQGCGVSEAFIINSTKTVWSPGIHKAPYNSRAGITSRHETQSNNKSYDQLGQSGGEDHHPKNRQAAGQQRPQSWPSSAKQSVGQAFHDNQQL
jgi:hypothetical protein